MAVGHIASYAGNSNKTAGFTVAVTGVSCAAGETVIVIVGCDNRASVEALSTTAVSDPSGQTWTRLLSQQSLATNASHCALAIYGKIASAQQTNFTITITPNSSVAAKAAQAYVFSGLSLTVRGLNGGILTNQSTPAALATSAPLDGDLVIGATVLEGPTTDTWTADSDTTNGSWSANQSMGTGGGTATDNISTKTQFKIVNATGTQTYNGSNSVGRDMCRGILALAPDPPPPAAAAPPVYTARYPIVLSTSVGRVTASVIDCYAYSPSAFDSRLPPLVYMAGAGSTGDELTGAMLPGLQPLIRAVCDAGFLVVSPTTILTYGNPTGQTGITNALSWARTNFGCSNLRAPLIGCSEGASDALTYAYLNPTLIACVVGIIPVIDLAEMVEQNVFGLGQAVLDAWSVGGLPLPGNADPNTAAHRTTLAGIPMQHWYSTNDEVSANITSFRSATNCDVRAVGELGHTDAAIAAVWPTEIVRFIRKRIPVS